MKKKLLFGLACVATFLMTSCWDEPGYSYTSTFSRIVTIDRNATPLKLIADYTGETFKLDNLTSEEQLSLYDLQDANRAFVTINLNMDSYKAQWTLVEGKAIKVNPVWNKPLPEGGDIVLDNVSFRYEGAETYTLRNISMRFGEKEKIAIVGHNGAGKTTLVKLLLRLYDAEGEITYGGVKISDFALSEYRDAFSAVMQDFHLFAVPVAENVLLRPRTQEDDEVITESLKKSGLYEKVKR